MDHFEIEDWDEQEKQTPEKKTVSQKKKKRKKSRNNGMLPLLLSLLGLVTLVLVLLSVSYLKNYYLPSKEVKYREVSLTEEAAGRAGLWLSGIEEVQLSYDEILECMGELKVQVSYTPTGKKGIYKQELIEETYDQCEQSALLGLEKAFCNVLNKRYEMMGTVANPEDFVPMTEDEIDELMKETFGVGLHEYFEGLDIQLLPTKDEMKNMYSGEVLYE